MKIILSNDMLIQEAPESFCRTIIARLTFENPAYNDAVKMNRWIGNIPKELCFFQRFRNGLSIPRGFTGQLIAMARKSGIPYQIEDRRRTLSDVEFRFNGNLKPFQEVATTTMLKKDFGTLAAPTGSGKTVMALAIIAERKQPTLIVVHTKELLNQWIDRIETFLEIPKCDVGIIGNGKLKIGKKITVSCVQSLYKCAHEVKDHIGHLVIDECHRAPSRTFTEAVNAFDSRYMLGLSATPWRRDGLSKLIFWHIGDVQHEVNKAALIESGDVLKPEVIVRETTFRPYSDPSTEYSQMLSELTADRTRNALIAGNVVEEAENGKGTILILSDRKSHCDTLQRMIQAQGVQADLLTGDLSDRERQEVVARLNDGSCRVVVATGALIGEGFDCKELSTLFMACPVKFSGRTLQYIGRILRPASGKERARVYDYVDPVGVLVASAKSRQRVYHSVQTET